MRKIVVLTFISLDGVMQAPGGKEEDISGGFKYGGWSVPYAGGDTMIKQMSMPFDLLLGRKTYEIFADYWPKHNDGVIGTSLNKAKKYVVSSGDIDLTWKDSILIKDDVVAKIKDLKNEDGPMLQVHGSSVLIQTLLKNDLADELWLKTYPVTLGKGKRLFGEGTIPAAFELIESETLPTGVIVASYKRAGAVKTGSFT
ncbi:MAG TPA: dihydrofolate reductase family protein [Candidatus Sulfotelmatobacter sp.]|nr:dihydrofolate reductase family protein [Candidatus Sulfotelmatobacter sp.]